MAEFYAPDTSDTNEINVSIKSLLPIMLVGAVTGFLAYILTLVISELIINPLFCQEEPLAICSNVASISGNIALIFACLGGLFGLVRAGAYRALLIILAVIATLWGFGGWLSGIAWFMALPITVLLFAVSYAAFSWLARINNFLVSLGVMAGVVMLARVLLLI